MRENRTYGLMRGQGWGFTPSRSTLLVKKLIIKLLMLRIKDVYKG